MAKICIVTRRTVQPVTPILLDPTTEAQNLTIALTPGQADIIRNNSHFQRICGHDPDQIFFTFHFGNSLPSRMIKPRDVCDMLQVSPSTLSKLIKQGRLKSYRIGRLRRFAVEDVVEYLGGHIYTRSETPTRLRAELVVMPKIEDRPYWDCN
jgi:excisionase family DNA binding protein